MNAIEQLLDRNALLRAKYQREAISGQRAAC
jgi:hypothetical protein